MKSNRGLLAVTLLLFVGCKKDPVQIVNPKYRDSEIIKKLEAFSIDGKYFDLKFNPGSKFSDGTEWEKRGWRLSLYYGEVSICGSGRTISDAYENALAEKEKLCQK